ncbi:hypothetical protein CkaCkLH20_01556 [Colletotrichum karsti]|uniref:Uncharacterized protein n=1 Tax=Colletotrichum karsti TaxID=1095194 RepID=A0A9P6LLK2_9PEZI|nr:uncharacterized protein CkaCkLH20_01556 [Colletotrichum karsti]KAF9880514.1 hypothetical protein CkaCkLH20_01556 [Colletotrichum karsti]
MDTMRETESVVLGLQALLAMSSQQRFYISLTEATYNYTAVASFARPALVPERWLGVILAGSLVAVQISLACAIAAYFLARTRMSAVDNAWQTLAQMVSHSTMDMLEQADTMTDDEVKALAREQLGKETAAGHGLLRYRGGRVGFEPL